MHSDRMRFTAIRKARVGDQVMFLGRRVVVGRVVAGRKVTARRLAIAGLGHEIEAAHQLHAVRSDALPTAAGLSQVASFRVEIGTIGSARTGDANVVTVGGNKAAERSE